MRIVITAALLMALPLSAFAQARPRAPAVSPQADEPRILEAATRLAAETRLQEPDRGERRAIQRIPLPAQIWKSRPMLSAAPMHSDTSKP